MVRRRRGHSSREDGRNAGGWGRYELALVENPDADHEVTLPGAREFHLVEQFEELG
jgi:hypothetical protein